MTDSLPDKHGELNLVRAAISAIARGSIRLVGITSNTEAEPEYVNAVLNALRAYESSALPPTAAQGAHPEDFCNRCNRPNVTWFAPSEIWNKAVRAIGAEEILCPVCFIQLAEAAGFNKAAWKIEPEGSPLSAMGAFTGDITKLDDDAHADAEGVRRFAAAMHAKMTEKRLQGYSGWHNDCTTEHLEGLLQKHITKHWDARNFTDMANFCMMLWNRAHPTEIGEKE